MSTQQFCLRWNNHQPNFISVFTTLLNNESLVDVTLAAEGRHLQAHKVVLSACSVYFQTLFTANPSRHPIVILKDVKYTDLRTMVDFMYYGEVNVSQEQLPQVLETAKMLKIKGLTEMPDATFTHKSQSTSTDRADLVPTGDHSGWGEQQKGNIPCNMSPSVKRKRVRKTSTCNSVLTMYERSTKMDDKVTTVPDAPTTCSSDNLVKTDTITLSSVSSVPNATKTKQQMLTVKDSQFMMMQKHSLEDAGIEIVMPESDDTPDDCILHNVDNSMVTESASDMTMQGPQWTMLDQGYQRYLATSCQGNSHQTSQSIDNVHTQDNSVQTFNVPIMNQHLNLDICEYQQEQLQHQQQQQASAGGGELETCSPGPSCGSINSVGVSDTVSAAGPPGIAAPKRRRTSNPQSEENFQRALEAVRFGGIGFCKAARMFGVNNRTLWLEYKKKGYPNNRPSIKNRIKQEHTSPPPEAGEMPSPAPPPEQQLTLLCPPHPVAMMGFVDSRQMDFSGGQNVGRPRFDNDSLNLHNSPINLHGINFNTLQ